MDPIGFAQHDHDTCIADGVSAAEQRCRDEGLQLTPVRRRVLELLLAEHRALGAYDILDVLREEGMGSQPPVAYRALDFLVTHGFAHRIEALNAFTACNTPNEAHVPAFLICRDCNSVLEAKTSLPPGALARTATATGFRIDRTVVEAQGLCPSCQDLPA
ncbi:Fur family transcriptional regulator [Pseudaestuariivita atlantica]|uniref:Fur family transcriptional regulator n=1 Tax=Pseudaestuariivita atlantica TaxID=1317121 RepID=A0A0L1JR05_9RHOB|nr:Fur family transcriptional regulator [Pseudaestuariivita atlantica]KNG94224.1 Fur family transcriptional regulator [Pseudaestuariivita atlantica]